MKINNFLEFIKESISTMRLFYSTEFRNILKDIQKTENELVKEVATFLLNSENSNQIEDKYTLIDITDKNDYISYIQVNRLVKDNPEEPYKEVNPPTSKFWKDENLRTNHKIGRWVTHLYKDVYKSNGYTAKQIEDFVNEYKSTFDSLGKPKFILLKGDDIKWAYLEDNYAKLTGQLGQSCMRYKNCQSFFNIYTENPDVCQLLVLKSDEGKVKGRALIWTLDNGTKYMDRIYTNDDSDKNLFIKWCEENNIDKNYTNYPGNMKVIVGRSDYNEYPYMDTFNIFDISGTYLSNNTSEDRNNVLELQSTSGGYSELDSGVWSDTYGEYIDPEYAVYAENIEDYVHCDDATYLEYKGIWLYNPENVVWSEYHNAWLYDYDSVYSEILQDSLWKQKNLIEFQNKDGEIDWVPKEQTHLYKEIDGEYYSTDYKINPYTDKYQFINDFSDELEEEFGTYSKDEIFNKLLDKLIEFKPTKEFLEKIENDPNYNVILNTYSGSMNKPTKEQILPIIYLGTLSNIHTGDTMTYWPSNKFKTLTNLILEKIGNNELIKLYKPWINSTNTFRNFLKFAYGFDYSNFDKEIYKMSLYIDLL